MLKAIFRLRQERFFLRLLFHIYEQVLLSLTHFLTFPSSVDKHFQSDKKYFSKLKTVNIAEVFASSSVDVDAVSLLLSLSIIHPPTDTRDNSLSTMFVSVRLKPSDGVENDDFVL